MNRPLLAAAFAAARFGFVALFGVGLAAAQTAPATEPKKEDTNELQKLEKFEVTGSRIKRTDIEGPSPIKVISRDDIEVSGMNNLTDIIREIPEATNIVINEGGTTSAVRGASAIDLRNLGPNNTLVLVDGRRAAPNGINSGGTVFVDLNRFANAMVERVEVLKDGASAVYGADATAGVVNIITRKDFSGAEFSARYGNYFKTDGGEQSYSFFGGVGAGKARATVGFAYTARNANAAVDEDISANADQTEHFRAYDAVKYAANLVPTAATTSAFDFRSTTGPYATVGVPTSAQLTNQGSLVAAGVYSLPSIPLSAIINPLTGVTATFLPGTGGTNAGTLGSSTSFASVPRGNNPARPTAAQFVARAFPAGDFSNSYNFQPFVWNVPSSQRRGISSSFAYDMSRLINFYAGLSYQKIESETHLAPSPISTAGDNNILVPASNYYNPFGIPVAFTYRPIEVGPRIANIVSNSFSYLAGVKGTLAEKFDWDLGWSYSSNDSTDTTTNAVSESRVRAALAKNTPDALNIFGGPTFKNNPATIEGIRVKSFKAGDADTMIFDFHVSTGELLTLPWGKLGSSFAVEHRIEHYNELNDALSTSLDDIIGQVRLSAPTRAKRDVDSVAAELRVPLVREGRYRWFNSVELSGAARFEKFSDGYDSGIKPFAGLRWRPTRDIIIRASYSGVFRSPTLPQLYGGVREDLPNGLPDLRRPQALTGDPYDGTAYQRLRRTGGNPNLTPEEGRTKQIGLVIDMPWKRLKGLSVDFTHGIIQQNNLISSLGTTFIRQNEVGGGTADLIVRDPANETYTNTTAAAINVLTGPNNTTTPVQPGQTVTVPGRIQYILDSNVNLASQIVRYNDYGIRYNYRTVDYGRFLLTSNWTYYAYYSFHRFAADPWVSAVGRYLPRYRGQSSVTWARKEWSGNLGMTYIHRKNDLTRDGYEVTRYYTFAGSLSYAFPAGTILGNTRLTVGLENILNRQPPLDYSGGAVGYNQQLVARPGGRFGFVNIRKSY